MKTSRIVFACTGLAGVMAFGFAASADSGTPPPPSVSEEASLPDLKSLTRVFWLDMLPNYQRWRTRLGVADSAFAFAEYLQVRRVEAAPASAFLAMYLAING
jgi:hypothetical protein